MLLFNFLVHPLLSSSIVILIISGIVYIYKTFKYVVYLKQLPGPKPHPIFLNLPDALVDEITIFKKLRDWARDFSPVYVILSFPYCFVNFTGPEDVEKLISTMKHSTKSMVYGLLHVWLGEGLLTSEGRKWQHRRKLLTSAFHFNILQEFVGVFHKEAEKLVSDLETLTQQNNVIDVISLIDQYALLSINETAMGTTLDLNDKTDREYKQAIFDIGKIILNRLLRPWLYFNFFYYNMTTRGASEKKAVKILHNFTNNVINNKIDEGTTKAYGNSKSYSKRKRMAMLDLLINAAREGEIDLKGIQDEINTFMFEGHDTSATSICFTLMLLANNENCQQRIYEELIQVLPDPDEEPTIHKLSELKYLERCIKESLRLYPSVPFISRILDEDFVTNDHFVIPKGTIANVHIYDVHRNPKIYPDPEKFDPDRFLSENVLKRHPFAYIPFSAGPRNCIGQKFATLEIKTVLCSILRKFKLEPVDTPETRQLCAELVIRTKNGIRVKFVKRN